MEQSVILTDAFTIREVSEQLRQLQEAVGRNDAVTVDARQVRTVDVAALQMLVAARKECSQKGKRLTVLPSDEVTALQSSTGIEL